MSDKVIHKRKNVGSTYTKCGREILNYRIWVFLSWKGVTCKTCLKTRKELDKVVHYVNHRGDGYTKCGRKTFGYTVLTSLFWQNITCKLCLKRKEREGK